ncbi:MAG TPA: lipopolysaccharide biosynthesis protein [Pseudolabrys sp.]|nr:lipopolysaccharide biosynthesis protein [Pseudolabrys sp.]
MSLTKRTTVADVAPGPRRRKLPFAPVFARAKTWVIASFGGGHDHAVVKRDAGIAFVIRVASAAAVYVSQVVLARWMGGDQFGIYVYAWTWVLLFGDLVHLGLPLAAQRLIPEYSAAGRYDDLRGFLAGTRRLAFLSAAGLGLLGAALVKTVGPHLDPHAIMPLYLACMALPFFTLSIMLDGIARSYNWIALGLAPHFLWRPIAVLALMALAYWVGLSADATGVMAAVVVAAIAMAAVQLAIVDRRLASTVAPGPRRYDVKAWLATSTPIILVAGFYTLLTYTDVLVLQQFRSPEDVALYYAAARTLLLVTFVSFSVSAVIAQRFSAHHLAGDRDGLAALVAAAVRWTFWPSLVATVAILAVGKPLLWLFGPAFTAGYPLMFILAVGLVARASIGPAERLLNMLGEQRVCALVYAAAFAVNLIGCIVLVPRIGVTGAAVALSVTMVFESAALFLLAWYRLGLYIFVFGKSRGGAGARRPIVLGKGLGRSHVT